MTLSINGNIYAVNEMVFPHGNYHSNNWAKSSLLHHHHIKWRTALKNTGNFHCLFWNIIAKISYNYFICILSGACWSKRAQDWFKIRLEWSFLVFAFSQIKLLACSCSQTKLPPEWSSVHGSWLAFSRSINFTTSNDQLTKKVCELFI